MQEFNLRTVVMIGDDIETGEQSTLGWVAAPRDGVRLRLIQLSFVDVSDAIPIGNWHIMAPREWFIIELDQRKDPECKGAFFVMTFPAEAISWTEFKGTWPPDSGKVMYRSIIHFGWKISTPCIFGNQYDHTTFQPFINACIQGKGKLIITSTKDILSHLPA